MSPRPVVSAGTLGRECEQPVQNRCRGLGRAPCSTARQRRAPYDAGVTTIVIAEDDDSFGGDRGKDPIVELELPDGVVTIEVSAYADETTGDYTLVVAPGE